MSKPADRPPAISPQIVDDILDEQRRRWSQNERVLVEDFIQRIPALATDSGIVLDLIYNEIVLREKAGEAPTQQEYLQRFPDLAADLALQFEVDGGLDWEMIADTPAPPEETESKPVRQQSPNRSTPYPSVDGYAITGWIGRGATGVVYKARQLSQDRSVALKVVLACTRRVDDAASALHAESAKLASLRHPHICPIYEIAVDAGRLVLAQERVEGNLLSRVGDPSVSPRQAAQWAESLARTVRDIHAMGIVHGNLTPANILVSFNGILKITDIGLARFCDPVPRSDLSELANYRAPELANGDRQALGPACDVFGIGQILRALLGSKSLRPQPNLTTPGISRELETICLHCLNTEPGNRYPTMAALAEDLAAFLAGKPIQARRTGILQRVMHAMRAWREPPRKGENTAVMVGHRRADRVQLVFDLACRLMRCTDLSALVRHLAEAAAWLTHAERAIVYIVDRDQGEFWAPTLSGVEVEEWRSPLDVGIAGDVVRTKQPVNLGSDSADPRKDSKTRNLLALPILNGTESVIGVIEIANTKNAAFSAEDTELLSNLLTAAAIAVERAEK